MALYKIQIAIETHKTCPCCKSKGWWKEFKTYKSADGDYVFATKKGAEDFAKEKILKYTPEAKIKIIKE